MSTTTDTTTNQPAVISNFGVSEITSFVSLVSAILTIFFGKDFGVSSHAQTLAPIVLAVVPSFLCMARSFKHHSVVSANAAVQVATIHAATAATAAAALAVPVVVSLATPVEAPVAVDAPVVAPVDVPIDQALAAAPVSANDGGI